MPVPPDHPDDVRSRLDAVTAACRAAGLMAGGQRAIDYGEQVVVSDGTQRVPVNVYGSKKGVRIVVGGPADLPLRATVAGIVAGLDGRSTEAPAAASAAPQAALSSALDAAALFPPGPWIGSDESGKGDYFGPLVAAAVYVRPEEDAALRAAGVRDSKLLEDATAQRVATEIRGLCAGRFAEIVLAPERYNARYEQYRAAGQNLNHLLAAGHVAVLEQLLAGDLPVEPPPTVIADQFADERLVRTALEKALRVRDLPMPALLQAPRAEANVAVAAASILARSRFLEWLSEAAERYGFPLPKGGANPAIIAAARRVVERFGRDELGRVAKLHFATSRRVLED